MLSRYLLRPAVLQPYKSSTRFFSTTPGPSSTGTGITPTKIFVVGTVSVIGLGAWAYYDFKRTIKSQLMPLRTEMTNLKEKVSSMKDIVAETRTFQKEMKDHWEAKKQMRKERWNHKWGHYNEEGVDQESGDNPGSEERPGFFRNRHHNRHWRSSSSDQTESTGPDQSEGTGSQEGGDEQHPWDRRFRHRRHHHHRWHSGSPDQPGSEQVDPKSGPESV